MTQGKLIVIDGTDGAGKETQTNLLKARLNSEGVHVVKYSFPNYDSIYGKMITNYLQGMFGPSTAVNPHLASLLYALDRGLVANEIKEHLEKGHYVLCDRYVESNMAYQIVKLPEHKRDEFSKWLTNLEHNELNIPESDAVIFLRVPTNISNINMSKRAELDGHESDSVFQQKVLKSYEYLAERDNKWKLINCIHNGEMRSREEIHEDIYQEIQ